MPFISYSYVMCHVYSEQVQNGMNEMSLLCLYSAKLTCSYQHSFSESAGWSSLCNAGVHALAESVHQNCVLGRCANLCSIIVLHIGKHQSHS